ncbi:ABC transporter related protein [Alkalidesulfovibrio alkalitolerans DSM 16529]|jgi:ABC-type branched-subunit amino acid transport system ATPase component|uniref:ABC transporter related protein n=1 Tax=Alkalidesulfovibrio alkalitolerans DSM 16529 TaxID=1121439 RepID=S7T4D0_9BACT|nr:ABC transporter ATP-binding protein [Alkalidesulfovibrio alkalitolerans]EPR31456.1 ABC transporter related protein [Alkalidesulfovibrio alkalitolerans DSM 16529]
MAAQTKTPLLQVDSISKQFGGLMALSDVSFDVMPGRIMGLIGPNGAGKTTLFNCIAGVYTPTKGRLLFDAPDGQRLTNGFKPEKMTALGIARTFQNIRLFSELTVLDNVRIGRHCRTSAGVIGAIFRNKSQREEEQRIVDDAMRWLSFVGLESKAFYQSSALSYGDQRRLEIARALATGPRLILLDEPAAGMNPQETASLVKLIHAIMGQGITVVLIEHDMKLVMGICEHLVVLDHGMKIAEGGPREIRENPQVIEAYLGRGAAHA